MQRSLQKRRQSDEEAVKAVGLVLDFDEIARKGSMSREEVLIAKWYGVYSSRQRGDHMMRVVIPGGDLAAAQARALGGVANQYAGGCLAFTTRQSAQFHRVQLPDIPRVLRSLADVGLTTFHGCGDVTRNVAACPWAPICPHRRLDVLPYAKQTAELIAGSRDLDNLPRKFKITYSGCGANCAQPYINCVGVTALVRERADGSRQNGFRVVIGGGMGWKGFVARELYSFVPHEQIVRTCRAIAMLFRDHGDRFNRAKARLKFVVDRLGVEKCREIVNANLDVEGVDRTQFETEAVTDCGEHWPARPLSDPEPRGSDGMAIARIMVSKGELTGDALIQIAELSERYGDKRVRSTNRQNLEIEGVAPRKLAELKGKIEELGFLADGFFGLADIVPCVGTTYCPLAVTETRAMYDLLQSVVHQPKYAPIRDKVIINITGCPNSCSPYRIADIGLRGLRVSEQVGSVEGYQILVGGTQEQFGQLVGEYKKPDCVRVVAALLDTFLAMTPRNPGSETLSDHVQRVGVGPYLDAVRALDIEYDMAAKPEEYSIVTGHAASRLDFKTIAKDIPCQEACPAKTNVPEYIRQIALERFEEAYRINQEDNVFPGVLGRICTRPCEPACRHMWTNTQGAVRICHLKRSAADRKNGSARPLAPWLESSGLRVAVIGGGPAGLAAARELKRYGHEVCLWEREQQPGGMMQMGIPTFRLPRDIVAEEIAAIVESGVEVRTGVHVDAERLAKIAGEFDATLVAAGAIQPIRLTLDELPEGVALEGLEFMKRYNRGDPMALSGDVVVIGGGFTAVDCARSARRLLGSAAHISAIMYRRGEEQMSASPAELVELRAEDVRVETLVTPLAAVVQGGKLRGVRFRRNVLGEAPKGEKPPMIPVPDSEFEVPCDTLIVAIGQTRTMGVLPEGVSLTEGHGTTRGDVFVAGDFAYGSLDVIHAVADGKAAADEIDRFLTGTTRREHRVRIERADDTGRVRDHDLAAPPAMAVLPRGERAMHAEVETGFGPQATDVNAWRCYLCDYKYEIDESKCIHCDWCIKVSPRACIRRLSKLQRDSDGAVVSFVETPAAEPEKATFIWIDSDQCIRCGNCIRICPTDAISLRKANRMEHMVARLPSGGPS